MALINSGSFAQALWPGVNAWYGAAYDEYPPEHTDIFGAPVPSTKAFEEDIGIIGMGLAAVKTEGRGIAYDDMQQGFTKRYTHVTYALGFIITREMYDDDLYDVAARRRAQALAFSMRQTKETVAANVLNRAFNSSYPGADGLELCSLLHVNKSGGTWANELATAADLSEASLEQACIDIGNLTNDRGLHIAVLPKRLSIPPDLEFDAGRILKSILTPDTANNAINVLRATGKIPEGARVNHYLTDADAWFLITNCPDGMKHFERRADEFGTENDWDTENAKFKATGRYSFGNTDPRGIFGSPGA